MHQTKCNNESEQTVKLTLGVQQRIDTDSSFGFCKEE